MSQFQKDVELLRDLDELVKKSRSKRTPTRRPLRCWEP